MSRLDLDDYLPYLLNRAGARIAEAFGRETRRHGISLQMWRVLAALQQEDGQSVGSLARRTSIEVSTLSRLLDQMQKKRLLLRRREAQDQRSITIHRTAAARDITDRLVPIARAYETRALIGFDAAAATHLKATLRRLYANLDALDEPAASARKSRAAPAARLKSKTAV